MNVSTASEATRQHDPQHLAILLVAAGSGSRFGGAVPKQFQDFAGQPLFLYSLRTLLQTRLAHRSIVIVPQGWEDRVSQWVQSASLRVDGVTAGGETRQDSVQRGLACLQHHPDWGCTHVLIHDAARPFVAPDMVRAVVAAVHDTGAATLAVPVSDTLMRARHAQVHEEGGQHAGELVDRSGMWAIQTPQVFDRQVLEKAHAVAANSRATDDGSLVLALGEELRFVPGAWWNLKVTHPEDFEKAHLIAAIRRLRQTDSIETSSMNPGGET